MVGGEAEPQPVEEAGIPGAAELLFLLAVDAMAAIFYETR